MYMKLWSFFALSHNYADSTFQFCLQVTKKRFIFKRMHENVTELTFKREGKKYFCIQVSNHYTVSSGLFFPSEEYGNVIICGNIVSI